MRECLKKKKKALREIRATRITKKVIEIVGECILSALEKGSEIKALVRELEEIVGRPLSYESVRRWVAEQKRKKSERSEKMKKRVILVANEKGGVGKTTVSTLLNLEGVTIVNLDEERAIKEIYPYKDVIDYAVEKEKGEVDSVEDVLNHLLEEDENAKYIVLDTKGHISGEWASVIDKIDAVIVPVEVGALSEEPTYDFIVILKEVFEEMGKTPGFAIVFNKVTREYLEKENGGERLGEKLLRSAERFREILGNSLKVVTYLRYTNAIKSREAKRLDVKEMHKENKMAYLRFKSEVRRLNEDLTPILEGDGDGR